jgi:RNA polymerase sigma-70 factor (ECF subfamily)
VRGADGFDVDAEPRITSSRQGATTRPGVPREDSIREERELVGRVKLGDAGAYDLLVRRYLSRAMAIARRLLHDPDDAEDLVQDAFMRALSRIESFDEQRAFGPWFFRLLINTGLNARKFRALRSPSTDTAEWPSPTPSPLELAERDDLRQRFRSVLSRLPARQRLVVSLFEVDGLSTLEIAAILGVTPETVRWHHHQARQTLRRELAAFKE